MSHGDRGGGTEELFESFFTDARRNAVLAWALVAVLGLVFVESLVGGDVEWIAFTVAAGAIVLVPPIARRSVRVMLPWELLLVALVPVVVRALDLTLLTSTFATYLSVAAFALIVTVELHLLTSMRVTHWFAVSLVLMTTLASAGVWAMVRFLLDSALGTSFLTTNEALMVEFLWVLAAGLVAALAFDLYFRPRSGRLRREVEAVGEG